MHTYRKRYTDTIHYVIEEVRSNGLVRQVSEDQINYVAWKAAGNSPEVVPYTAPVSNDTAESLAILKQQKIDEIDQMYNSLLRAGSECMSVDYPGVRFSMVDASIQKFKSIIDYADMKGLSVIPFLYPVDGERLENVPVETATAGLLVCFEEAMALYVKRQQLMGAIDLVTKVADLDVIVWQS